MKLDHPIKQACLAATLVAVSILGLDSLLSPQAATAQQSNGSPQLWGNFMSSTLALIAISLILAGAVSSIIFARLYVDIEQSRHFRTIISHGRSAVSHGTVSPSRQQPSPDELALYLQGKHQD